MAEMNLDIHYFFQVRAFRAPARRFLFTFFAIHHGMEGSPAITNTHSTVDSDSVNRVNSKVNFFRI